MSTGTPIKKCNVCGREYMTDEDLRANTSRWRTSSDGSLWFNCGCGTTLFVPSEAVSWYSPERSMSDKARKTMRDITREKKVPYLSTATFKVQLLLSNPESAPEDIAQAIRQDPVLAGQVMAQANAVKVCTGEKITSLEHAIVYIGRKMLGELVVMASLRMIQFGTKRFNPKEFWEEALLTASISEFLAQNYGAGVSVDEAYLAGALCNIGKVIAAVVLPEVIDKVVAEVELAEGKMTWLMAERRIGVVDHLLFNEIAFSLWGLPPQLVPVVMKHHDEPVVGVSYKGLVLGECVAMANQLMLHVLGKKNRMDRRVLDPLSTRIGMDDNQMSVLCDQIYVWRRKIQEIIGR